MFEAFELREFNGTGKIGKSLHSNFLEPRFETPEI